MSVALSLISLISLISLNSLLTALPTALNHTPPQFFLHNEKKISIFVVDSANSALSFD